VKKYRYLFINNAVTINEGVNLAFVAMANELCMYYEALQSPYSKQWENTIKSKFAQLKKAKISEWVDKLPKGKKTVESQIVFKKLDGYRNQVKFKTQIVAKDFSQVSGEDFTEMFSFVTKFTTLCTFLTLTTFLDFKIY